MANDLNQQRLQNYIDAEKRALDAQQYTIGGETIARADLSKIRDGINSLVSAGGATVNGNTQRGSRARRIILRDL